MNIKDYRKKGKILGLWNKLHKKGWHVSQSKLPIDIWGKTDTVKKQIFLNKNIKSNTRLLIVFFHEIVHACGIGTHGPSFYEALGRVISSSSLEKDCRRLRKLVK